MNKKEFFIKHIQPRLDSLIKFLATPKGFKVLFAVIAIIILPVYWKHVASSYNRSGINGSMQGLAKSFSENQNLYANMDNFKFSKSISPYAELRALSTYYAVSPAPSARFTRYALLRRDLARVKAPANLAAGARVCYDASLPPSDNLAKAAGIDCLQAAMRDSWTEGTIGASSQMSLARYTRVAAWEGYCRQKDNQPVFFEFTDSEGRTIQGAHKAFGE
jgi:hypothetical protein